MIPEEYIERLAGITNKKYSLLQDMLSLTNLQVEAICEDGLSELEKILTLKQEKIDEIDLLDEQFDVYFSRLKQELKVRSLDELKSANIAGAKELQESVSGVMSLIKEISSLESSNGQKAKELLGQFADEIKRINQAKKTNGAYYSPYKAQAPSYYFDRKK